MGHEEAITGTFARVEVRSWIREARSAGTSRLHTEKAVAH